MKKIFETNFRKLAMVMISVMMVLAFTACASKESAEEVDEAEVETEAEVATEVEEEEVAGESAEAATIATDDEKTTELTKEEITMVGEGDTMFVFTVTFEDATVHIYEVSTNETTVGEALLAEGLIEGEDSEFGLYVKTVDGVTLDYDTDGAYWGFYIDGESSMSGVDLTDIVEGTTYSLAYAK